MVDGGGGGGFGLASSDHNFRILLCRTTFNGNPCGTALTTAQAYPITVGGGGAGTADLTKVGRNRKLIQFFQQLHLLVVDGRWSWTKSSSWRVAGGSEVAEVGGSR